MELADICTAIQENSFFIPPAVAAFTGIFDGIDNAGSHTHSLLGRIHDRTQSDRYEAISQLNNSLIPPMVGGLGIAYATSSVGATVGTVIGIYAYLGFQELSFAVSHRVQRFLDHY